jgi:leucyl aminopeptidase
MKIQIPRSLLASHVQLAQAAYGKKSADSVKSNSGVRARVYVLNKPTPTQWATTLSEELEGWQVTTAVVSGKDLLSSTTARGPRIFLRRAGVKGPFSHQGKLEDSTKAWFREQGGSLLNMLKASTHDEIEIVGHGLDEAAWAGLFLGMELASYQFKAEAFAGAGSAKAGKKSAAKSEVWSQNNWSPKIRVEVRGAGPKPAAVEKILKASRALGTATNFARHLVNLPPNVVNPTTVAAAARELFSGKAAVKLEIWDEKKLKAEGMGLHLGVGAGSPTPPCMVHVKYRPSKAPKGLRPVALVGKGVTFDTGGLDIKPSAGMRLMKKDMGGAAAVMALAWWAVESQFAQPLDFYLALAENSVDGLSMRPSDVLIARNGKSVEIHNTDAEGRLVLADVLDVAVTKAGADEPELVINLATLTGAIKVALGAEIAGLFSNDDRLSTALEKAGSDAGELAWRMPLLSRYANTFSSNFADMVNAVDGFGGAITAALFLERFVRNKSWAHLDIYGWNDKPTGALGFAGGNGQGVQTIVSFLENR